METLGNRIERLRRLAGISQAELARRADVKQQAINRAVNSGTKAMRGVERVARVLGTTAEYLLTGQGEAPSTGDEAQFVTIPRLDPAHQDAPAVGQWKMRRALVEDLGLPLDSLGLYRASNQDAIASLVPARALVLVDRRATHVEREGVYLTEIDGAIRLRLCSRDYTTGALIVSPSVPGLPAQTIAVPQMARARVFGRAVFVMSELP